MATAGSVDRLWASIVVFPVLAGPALAQAPRVAFDGNVETFYSYNFGEPADAVTRLRGFDNRHNSLTLSNLAAGATATAGRLAARLALQVGVTPNTYYLAEPTLPATGGAGASDQTTWRLVQEAWLGWRAGGTRDFQMDAGLFLSPIGHEVLAVKDNWNWSRSTLFYALPFYHTGARASVALGGGARLTGMVFNGWNSVNDNNGDKSVALQLTRERGRLSASALYFGGVERENGAPEGQPWRHLGDAWARITISDRLALVLHANAGFEDGDLGTSDWYAGAVWLRAVTGERTALAARVDGLSESAPAGARAIFWPATDANGKAAVGSFTITGDWRPGNEPLLLRLELRRDVSNVAMYVKRGALTDFTGNLVPNATSQTTVTLGAVAWF